MPKCSWISEVATKAIEAAYSGGIPAIFKPSLKSSLSLFRRTSQSCEHGIEFPLDLLPQHPFASSTDDEIRSWLNVRRWDAQAA